LLPDCYHSGPKNRIDRRSGLAVILSEQVSIDAQRNIGF